MCPSLRNQRWEHTSSLWCHPPADSEDVESSLPPKKSSLRAQQPLCCALTLSPSPDDKDSYLDVEVRLKREQRGSGRDNFVEWWVLRLKDAPPRDGNILPLIIFNDKVSPPSLGFLAGYGYVEGARVGADPEGIEGGIQGSRMLPRLAGSWGSTCPSCW